MISDRGDNFLLYEFFYRICSEIALDYLGQSAEQYREHQQSRHKSFQKLFCEPELKHRITRLLF